MNEMMNEAGTQIVTSAIKTDEENKMSKSDEEKKSTTAIVEYKPWQPTQFNVLQMNTNLNKPPSNWLRGSSRWEQYIRDTVWSKERSDISSLVMAHKSPGKVGEVDVISDSDNIKKLLKIPYSKSHVSMMVHRVGKTILIDEFDVHKHLLRQQKDDWKWLRNFYYDTVLQSMQGEKCFGRRTKTRDFLQNQNMFSKFLYYSLPSNESRPKTDDDSSEPAAAAAAAAASSMGANQTASEQCNTEDTYHSEEFQRTHLWTFEDIRMWIGTDLPIFGGSNHPCVSLKLRDARKPINVLTGLDFWLDNLMCNVPELAMCYHVNGIVQRYEIMKTEDIPKLENSQFEPEVIKDIAQNILSFLKSNATKEGHTYWLFKGSDQDVVKLYDLTCLCGDEASDMRNPFSVPLGVLLFRVAQNTWQASGRKKSGLIKTLLKSCIILLDKTAHAQIITSANYLLADLYIKDDLYDQSLEKQDEEEVDDDDDEDEIRTAEKKNESCKRQSPVKSKAVSPKTTEATPGGRAGTTAEMPVKVLCLPECGPRTQQVLRYHPVTGNIEERCQEALEYIKQALVCLDENSESERLNQPQRQVNPNEVIPLKYERLNRPKHDNNATYQTEQEQDELTSEQTFPADSWHQSTKLSLLHKACLIFYWLADCKIKQFKFGIAMRYTRNAFHCYSAMYALEPGYNEDTELLSALLGQSADIHVMLVHDMKNSASHGTDYDKTDHTTEIHVIDSVKYVLSNHEYLMFAQYSNSIEQNLTVSCRSYHLALDIVKGNKQEQKIRKNLNKRYGNVCNELGVYFMNQTASYIHEELSSNNYEKMLECFNKSLENLNSGISAFENIDDEMNIALLYSNRGRLMRLFAQASGEITSASREFTQQERSNYQKAIDDYHRALSVLNSPQQSDVTDSICWELSSTYFTMATMLQDYAPLSLYSQEEIEKDVTCLMNEALKYCDVTEQSSRLPTCQYRAATIHHRLASLYHNSYRNQVAEQKRRHLRTLAEWHYGKCSKYFLLVESPCELLRVQLERVAMCEYQLNCQTSANTKIKTLNSALYYLLDCRVPLLNIIQQMDEQTEFEGYRIETGKLSKILHSRLQFITLQLIKNSNIMKKSEKKESQLDLYKNMYSMTLKLQYKDELSALHKNCVEITRLIELLQQLYQHHQHHPGDPSASSASSR
ncbi:erythroid differentiation-related factor 1-like [Tubulanus polymorphus]|uniref:erythroid differentiation-related factor 1-like n=1 Tax=Tubulanus polymorphus TaxID=672921 RepID=UPI003DA2DE70